MQLKLNVVVGLNDNQVLFDDIPSGRYSISLVEDGIRAGIYHFEIKDSRHGGE